MTSSKSILLMTISSLLLSCSPPDKDYITNTNDRWPKQPKTTPKLTDFSKDADVSFIWTQWFELNRRLEILKAVQQSGGRSSSSCYRVGAIKQKNRTQFSVVWNCQQVLSPFRKKVSLRGREKFILSYEAGKGWKDFLKNGSFKKLVVQFVPITDTKGPYGMHFAFKKSNRMDGLYLQNQNLVLTFDDKAGSWNLQQEFQWLREPLVYNAKSKKNRKTITNYWALRTEAALSTNLDEILTWTTEVDHELITRQEGANPITEIWQYEFKASQPIGFDSCDLPNLVSEKFTFYPQKGKAKQGVLSRSSEEWGFQLGQQKAQHKFKSSVCSHPFGFAEQFVRQHSKAKY